MKSHNLTYRSMSLLLICLLPALSLNAQEAFKKTENQDAVLGMLNESGSGIQSINSTFIQEKHLQFLDETIISSGRFWFRKENSLRWAYEEPFSYAIIIHDNRFQIRDGDKLSSYDIDANPAFREINALITDLVQGKVATDGRFKMEILENHNTYLVKMHPLDQNLAGVISGMEIHFLKKDLQVDHVIIREGPEDFTLIRFTERKINESIPDSIFTVTN